MLLPPPPGTTLPHNAPPLGFVGFVTRTWLGNIVALVGLVIAILMLVLALYLGVIQALATKWSLRNDALQSCIAANGVVAMSEYCNDSLAAGVTEPPIIKRQSYASKAVPTLQTLGHHPAALAAAVVFTVFIGLSWIVYLYSRKPFLPYCLYCGHNHHSRSDLIACRNKVAKARITRSMTAVWKASVNLVSRDISNHDISLETIVGGREREHEYVTRHETIMKQHYLRGQGIRTPTKLLSDASSDLTARRGRRPSLTRQTKYYEGGSGIRTPTDYVSHASSDLIAPKRRRPLFTRQTKYHQSGQANGTLSNSVTEVAGDLPSRRR